MEMNIGYRAATRQSYSEVADMKELVVSLLEEYPQAPQHEIITRFRERARDNEEYLNACVEYAVLNTWNNIQRLKARSPLKPVAMVREERQAQAAAREEKAAEIAQQIMLLNQEMPNGKRLRYCTREDLSGFKNGYDRMVKKMKPGQMVGQAFSEDQVKAIMK